MPTLPPDLSRWPADRLITKARAIASKAGENADAICQKFNQGRRLEELTCRELAELICAVMINACGYADVFIPEERENILPEPFDPPELPEKPDWSEEPGTEFRTPAGGNAQTPQQETEREHGEDAHGTKDESRWQGTVANLRRRLRECRLSVTARDERIDTLKIEVTSLENELRHRDERIITLENELRHRDDRIITLEKKLREQGGIIHALEKELLCKSAVFRFPQSS